MKFVIFRARLVKPAVKISTPVGGYIAAGHAVSVLRNLCPEDGGSVFLQNVNCLSTLHAVISQTTAVSPFPLAVRLRAQEADSWKCRLSSYMEFGDLSMPIVPHQNVFPSTRLCSLLAPYSVIF
jgi:hypothetical protein